jgi:nucleoside-diphosphate-sugar epimerase
VPQEKILVTGATGHVGSHFVLRAVKAGYTVRALVRNTSNTSLFEHLPVELAEGDLAKPETLAPALEDVDLVIHSGAHVGDWGPAETYRQANVISLEHMLTTAQRVGQLKRWIQISSLGVYPARHHYGTDETVTPNLGGLDGYTQTKAEAEVMLGRHRDQFNLPFVILRPGFIYGAGDRHALPRIIEKLQVGKMKFIGRGDRLLNNTYVGNLVDAIFLAMEQPAAIGETFNIRDERLVTRLEFVNTIADYLGKPHPAHIPEALARLLVRPIERVAKLRGATSPPLLTSGQIKFMTLNLDYSIDKAKRLLGYQPQVDFQEGIRQALDHLVGDGPRSAAPSERTESVSV